MYTTKNVVKTTKKHYINGSTLKDAENQTQLAVHVSAANCVCVTLMRPCCSYRGLPSKLSTEPRQATKMNHPQSSPAADKKSHLTFAVRTPALLSHCAHVHTSADLYERVRWKKWITHQKDVSCSAWHFTFSNKSHAQRGHPCLSSYHFIFKET